MYIGPLLHPSLKQQFFLIVTIYQPSKISEASTYSKYTRFPNKYLTLNKKEAVNMICRIMPPPKDIHVLIPRICECAMLYGKGGIRKQVRLRLSISCPYNKEILLDYPSRYNGITKVLLQVEACPLKFIC